MRKAIRTVFERVHDRCHWSVFSILVRHYLDAIDSTNL